MTAQRGKLGTLARFIDYRGKTPMKTDSGVPLITAKNIRPGYLSAEPREFIAESTYDAWMTRGFPRVGDVLITTEAPLGNVVCIDWTYKFALAQRVICLQPNGDLVNGPFLAQMLQAPDFQAQLVDRSTGTTVSGIKASRLKELDVPLPPLDEQRRIVAKLETLQTRSRRAREALEAVPSLLEKLRQSILATAFRGDLTKDWRAKNKNVEPASKLVARTAEPDGKSSGRAASDAVRRGVAAISVGDPGTPAPKGWSWVPLSRIARMESGHTPSRANPVYWNGEIGWIGIPDAREHCGRTIKATLQRVTEEGLANSAARLLPAGTVCFSRTASVGYATIMGVPMATSQDFANWVCSEALLPEYLMFALLAEGAHIRSFGEGSTHTTIYFPELKAFYICLAPLAEQHEIVRRVRAALARVEALRARMSSQFEELKTMERAILAQAFRGELVPQDPNDESAEKLLARIGESRGGAKESRKDANGARRSGRERQARA